MATQGAGAAQPSSPAAGRHLLDSARQIADEILFPTALRTDAAELVPREHLDALADAGLYGLTGPVWAGGHDAPLPAACAVIELLAGGCLTTTFVWTQHLRVVRAVASSASSELRERWTPELCSGAKRAGVVLAPLRPGDARLRARRVDGGWRFDGVAPWLTGWGRIDVVQAAALDEQGNIVWGLLDAHESDSLRVERLRLVAANASATVRVALDDHFVSQERIVTVNEPDGWPPINPGALRNHAALALGIAGRCCELLGPTALDAELTACRAALDHALTSQPFATMPAARATASELALRAAAALCVAQGSRSVLADQHPQRLAREATFMLVFGLRDVIRDALLDRFAAPLAAGAH